MCLEVCIVVKTGKDAVRERSGCILQSDWIIRISQKPVADTEPSDKGKDPGI